jgi:hypothetical protein
MTDCVPNAAVGLHGTEGHEMWSIRMCAAVLAAATLAAAASAAAASGASVPVTVKGTQTVINESKGKYAMQGDLVGAWNTTAFTIHYQGVDGQFVGSGRERFSGCRDADRSDSCDPGEAKGTIRFSFVYWATYDPKTKALVKGQCVHPILGGTGAFAGIKGVIHMKDAPTASGVRTTYTGTLVYPGSGSATTTSVGTRALSSHAVGACGS